MAELTIYGKLLKALARREDHDFRHWLAEINRQPQAEDALSALLYEAFREAVVRRFGSSTDLREVVGFLAEPRRLMTVESVLPVLEAEALIRSALGERGLVDGIPSRLAVDLHYQLYLYIVEDLAMTEADLHALLVDAERWASE